jgi:hypothetical protein
MAMRMPSMDLPVAAQFLADGVQVQQSLAGVLVGAVAGIDHRHATGAREFGHGVGLRVAHHDDVVVAADDARGVVQ